MSMMTEERKEESMNGLWCIVVECSVYIERKEGGIRAQRRSRRVVQHGMHDEAKK
jgi:hypothetical protein